MFNLNQENVIVTGRIDNARLVGKRGFLILRKQHQTLQIYLDSKNFDIEEIKKHTSIKKESIVEIEGKVIVCKKLVLGCTIKEKEIHAQKITVICFSKQLPFTVEEASRSEDNEKELSVVNIDTRLNNRTIDLRTAFNNAIFRIKAKIEQEFQVFLWERDFVKINSPKIISTASEGGANVFKINYFNENAYLAQSPQLYKQMAICSDFRRVYEIGPVFRAENSFTHRHLTEYTGLDFEMEIEKDYHEICDVIHELIIHILKKVHSECANEIEIVRSLFPSEQLLYTEEPVLLNYKQGISLLREAGYTMNDYEDLCSEKEKILGEIVRKKYKTDFYGLDKYPTKIRPFYAMKDKNDPEYSNTFDYFIRGEEILSGGQRINDYDELVENVEKNNIQRNSLKGYLDAFKYGTPKHGGIGIGLERLTMLILDLKNIRRASMFPRDPSRLCP